MNFIACLITKPDQSNPCSPVGEQGPIGVDLEKERLGCLIRHRQWFSLFLSRLIWRCFSPSGGFLTLLVVVCFSFFDVSGVRYCICTSVAFVRSLGWKSSLVGAYPLSWLFSHCLRKNMPLWYYLLVINETFGCNRHYLLCEGPKWHFANTIKEKQSPWALFKRKGAKPTYIYLD